MYVLSAGDDDISRQYNPNNSNNDVGVLSICKNYPLLHLPLKELSESNHVEFIFQNDRTRFVLEATRIIQYITLVEENFQNIWFDEILKCSSTADNKERDNIIVDVGANHGLYGIWAAKHGCNVYMFEPQPSCHDYIKQSILLNRPYANHENSPKLFGNPILENPADSIFVHEASDCHGGFGTTDSITNAKNDPNGKRIYGIDAMKLFEGKTIKLIKIDVEGHELGVLKHLMIGFKNHQIEMAVVECTPERWIEDHRTSRYTAWESIFKPIAAFGYEIWVVQCNFPFKQYSNTRFSSFMELENMIVRKKWVQCDFGFKRIINSVNKILPPINKFDIDKHMNEMHNKISILSPLQGDIIQSKDNKFSIQWKIHDHGELNDGRDRNLFYLKVVINSISRTKSKNKRRKESIIYDYVNNRNALVDYTIYGTYSLELQIISLSNHQIVDTLRHIFTVLPSPDAFRKKPYDTYTADDFDLLKKTCPSLISNVNGMPNNFKESTTTISYIGNLNVDSQKIIWLEQMLNNNNNKFQYRYINFWLNKNIKDDNHLEEALNERNVPLLNLQINIDGENNIWQLNETYTSNLLLEFSNLKSQNVNREHIKEKIASKKQLNWLNQVWKNVTNVFRTTDIAVFPNSNEVSLQFYFRAARYAGVKRIIVEMSHWNVESLQNADVDVIIVPSMYSYKLVNENLKLKSQQSFELCHVSPSVGGMIDYVPSSAGLPSLEGKNTTTTTPNTNGDDLFTIGVVSRLSYEKNIGLFISVASALKFKRNVTAKYIIIGTGPAMDDLKYLAKQLNVSEDIIFLGYLNSIELSEHVSQFDIFFNPTTLKETFCIANIKAMALGIPVISMGLVDGSMEYVDDVSSVGIDLSSTVTSSPSSILDNIVDIVLHLLQNEIKRKRIGHRGRAKVKRHYLKKNTMDKYNQIYLSK